MEEWITEKLQKSDMLLIGIGEEFEERSFLKAQPEYERGLAYLQRMERLDLLPLLAAGILNGRGRAVKALQKLYGIIADQNFFLISTCQTDIPRRAGFPENRVVTPCGTLRKSQCVCGCEQSLTDVGEDELAELYDDILAENLDPGALGSCPGCHGKMALNNICLENYLESGYMEDWGRYTRWLQGTLNRNVCILELGVGLDYPTVIRFPFEKMGYYNQKASFIRINKKLPYLTKELNERGRSMEKNSIDLLLAGDIL